MCYVLFANSFGIVIQILRIITFGCCNIPKYKCKHEKCCEPLIIHQPDDINYNLSIYSNYCANHYKINNMKNTLIKYL